MDEDEEQKEQKNKTMPRHGQQLVVPMSLVPPTGHPNHRQETILRQRASSFIARCQLHAVKTRFDSRRNSTFIREDEPISGAKEFTIVHANPCQIYILRHIQSLRDARSSAPTSRGHGKRAYSPLLHHEISAARFRRAYSPDQGPKQDAKLLISFV